MDFVKKNIKWITLGGCVLAIISLFLPFATVSAEFFGMSISESVNYIEGDGVIVFATIIVAGVLIFLKKDVFSLIPLGIGTAITIYSAVNVGKEFGDIESLYGDALKVGFGVGFYLLLVGLILAMALVAYNHFVLNKNGGAIPSQSYDQGINQGYQPYSFNQQPIEQPSYGQPFVNQPVNDNFGSVGMPTSQVDTNIFNQQPVVQPSPMMENQPQPMAPIEMPVNQDNTNMFNQMPIEEPNAVVQNTPFEPVAVEQPFMNSVPQDVPVQDFSSPAAVTCPQCRATLNSGAQFCNQCGSKIN